MKLTLLKSVGLILLLLAGGTVHAESASEALRYYVSAGDTQDTAKLESILHDHFSSTFEFAGKGEIRQISREDMIEGFRRKKFGGDPRSSDINVVAETDNFSLLSAELKGSRLQFNGLFVFVRGDDKWQLQSEYLVVTPVKS
jgi:hypothetical protein